MTQTKQALKPGDRVRATIEATVLTVDKCGVILQTPQRLIYPGINEGWSFEVLTTLPVVGDVIARDDVNNYEWADGAVLRTTVPNAPIHRAGGEWWIGPRGVFIGDFPGDAMFDVLAVGA